MAAASGRRPENATANARINDVASKVSLRHRRIGLLTPYEGGNLGDAAIQDAMISNLRHQCHGAKFYGISLNCENFIAIHGDGAFPLCATSRPFYGTADANRGNQSKFEMPSFFRKIRAAVVLPWGEFQHILAGYRFLRSQNLVIVSGGGQLDDEWGGPLGHPFALFKWAILARLAGVPYAIASVGACKIGSPLSRFFLSIALRLARYRSYRDHGTREVASSLYSRAEQDPIVPDLAFSLACAPRSPHMTANRRIAVSAIAFSKPKCWPREDANVYERYLTQMASVIAALLSRGDSVTLVCSSRGDDESVIPELVARVVQDARNVSLDELIIPSITSWRDFVSEIRKVDFLVASRLHSTIFGFITQTPTVAISFDPKVDRVMEDLDLSEYLLSIRDFEAEEVISSLDRLELFRNTIVRQIEEFRQKTSTAASQQYDVLARLAMESER